MITQDVRFPSTIHRAEVDAAVSQLARKGISASNTSMGDSVTIELLFANEDTARKVALALDQLAKEGGFDTLRRGYAGYDSSCYKGVPTKLHLGSGAVSVHLEAHPDKTVADAIQLLLGEGAASILKMGQEDNPARAAIPRTAALPPQGIAP